MLPDWPMRSTPMILSIFAAMVLAGCGGSSRERTAPAAERADPGAPHREVTPDDLRTGEGDVGATGRRSERPAGVMGEQGPAEAGGAGTATETGEIVGRSDTPKKQSRDAKR
jgi:hypothetical protein